MFCSYRIYSLILQQIWLSLLLPQPARAADRSVTANYHPSNQVTSNTSCLFSVDKPGPPCFAQSTILVISPSHLPNIKLTEFISKLLVTLYACAKCNITALLVINRFQSIPYITAMYESYSDSFQHFHLYNIRIVCYCYYYPESLLLAGCTIN